jgi:hypothetical protein
MECPLPRFNLLMTCPVPFGSCTLRIIVAIDTLGEPPTAARR